MEKEREVCPRGRNVKRITVILYFKGGGGGWGGGGGDLYPSLYPFKIPGMHIMTMRSQAGY